MKGHLPDSFEHAAHASHEANLLLDNLASVALGLSLLVLLGLLLLLLGEDGLNVGVVHAVGLALKLVGAALLHEVFHHVTDLLHEEGDGPLEEIHALGQVERMLHVLVLFNVHFVVLDQDYGALVVVLAAVVWRAENSDDRWEGLMATPTMHFVAVNLDLMSTDDRDEVVSPQNLLDRVQAELNRALTLWVGAEALLASVTVVHRVGPEQITEEALERWLNESIHLVDVVLVLKLRRDATVHAKVVSVDVGGDGHGLEAGDEELVDLLIVELLKDF